MTKLYDVVIPSDRLDSTQELASAAQKAWTVWDHRPRLIVGDKINPNSTRWMMEQRKAMSDLGAVLMALRVDSDE